MKHYFFKELYVHFMFEKEFYTDKYIEGEITFEEGHIEVREAKNDGYITNIYTTPTHIEIIHYKPGEKVK